MSVTNQTILEIDIDALTYNFNFLKSKINQNTKFLAVVKANGYGGDSIIIAKHLEKLKVDYFAVAYTEEGVNLRKAGIKTPILVLHPQIANFNEIIQNCLEPSLYSPRIFNAFLDITNVEQQNNYPIHLKFNTGLNRLGFWENDVDFIIKRIEKSSNVKIKSIFSHLAASEDLDEKEFTLNQIENFKKITYEFEQKLGYSPMLHQLNTSGILNYAKQAQFDMVRSGIGLYGFANDEKLTSNLKNVFSLKSIISQIHKIEPNKSIGYNRAFRANDYMKTATIPIGHADGIHRAFGNNNGYVYINDKKASIIGNVCMDMIMVDITNIDCKEGDEVIIFNSQETVNDLALRANTISYELLTVISPRVKRILKES